jgi:prepilin-type N-terminal cleavage/methylation domain-containing protein
MKSAPISRSLARAFSLIELLVVIAIIALVVSLVIPAVGSARRSARDADTRSLCASLEQACHQYVLDNRRNPGYFSAREMGGGENATLGFSAMQNVMLDLAGGIVASSAPGVNVGPSATGTVRVSPELIGSASNGNKAYFSPKGKYFQLQDGTNQDGGTRASNAENARIPEVVDAEGTPILIWTVDESCNKAIATAADYPVNMARQDSSTGISRFYWVSNAAFLGESGGNAPQVGKRRIAQANANDARGFSLIGAGVSSPDIRARNLAAILSSPNSPVPFAANATADQILPSAPRGQFIIHAAGRDGIYLNRNDRGGKSLGNAGGLLHYGSNFKPAAEDILRSWDDIVISGN